MDRMKPILFNTEMVRAILEGRKKVTRRIANISTEIHCGCSTDDHDFVPDNFNHPEKKPTGFVCRHCGFGVAPPYCRVPCGESLFRPRYWPGDILYVRETWCDPTPEQSGYPILYKADMPMHWDADDVEFGEEVTLKAEDYKWRPSIHMPKEAARIFLRVTGVRVERLQAISADECTMEGVWPLYAGPIGGREAYYKTAFAKLWNSTIEPAELPFCGWEANPLVWVYRFEQISKEEAIGGVNDA